MDGVIDFYSVKIACLEDYCYCLFFFCHVQNVERTNRKATHCLGTYKDCLGKTHSDYGMFLVTNIRMWNISTKSNSPVKKIIFLFFFTYKVFHYFTP